MIAVVRVSIERERGDHSMTDAIARFCREDLRGRVVAVSPHTIAFFATSPERYEVTEVDVVVDTKGAEA